MRFKFFISAESKRGNFDTFSEILPYGLFCKRDRWEA